MLITNSKSFAYADPSVFLRVYDLKIAGNQAFPILNLREVIAYDKHDERIDPISSVMSSEASPDVAVSKCHEFAGGGNDNGFCQSSNNKRSPDWDPWLVFEYPADVQIRRITVLNRPCCTGRIAGASICVSSDKDGKRMLWSGKFLGVRKLYTWKVQFTPATTTTPAVAITTASTTSGAPAIYFNVVHARAGCKSNRQPPHAHLRDTLDRRFTPTVHYRLHNPDISWVHYMPFTTLSQF